jgi:hypothetical protein
MNVVVLGSLADGVRYTSKLTKKNEAQNSFTLKLFKGYFLYYNLAFPAKHYQ